METSLLASIVRRLRRSFSASPSELCSGGQSRIACPGFTKAIPFLLTWNCRHLANAVMRPVIETVCKAKGFKAPIICTPEELLEPKP